MRVVPLTSRQFVEELIDEYGLEAAWKVLLRGHIKNSGPQFAYMLKTAALRGHEIATSDVLRHLTVGEVSFLYEYSLAYNNRSKRKDEGQYFTPDDVSQFLAGHARNFPKNITWVDPCSGIGNLSYWLVKQQRSPEQFVQNNLYLIDKDPLALLIARVLFTLAFQKDEPRLFTKLAPRFVCRDFLTATDLPAFDAAILNPPYVSGVKMNAFKTAPTGNLYAYFLERVASHCPAGYISITPQTFTNAQSFRSLRSIILAAHNNLDVFCFDNIPDNIFSGIKFGSVNTNKVNSTRAGVIVATQGTQPAHRITPLLRWRTHERAQMLESAADFLASAAFTENLFPKVSKELRSFYDDVMTFATRLHDVVTEQSTDYALQVPTTPRYFISANKSPVQRTSYKILYFASEHDMNRAYVVLNSSYMYWWWRVNDGGMTISEKTLLTLPLPDVNARHMRDMVTALERSEQTSKVVKRNAGKATENVKHPAELVQKLTHMLFPEYALHLTATHANSFLSSSQQLALSY